MPRKSNVEDYIGKVFGSLKILEEYEGECKGTHVTCECSCGEVVVKRLALVKRNKNVSCGCRGLPPLSTEFTNTEGLNYKVIGYRKTLTRGANIRRAVVKFIETGFTREVDIKEMKIGSVKDLLSPSIAGVGFVGEGVYGSRGKDTLCYQTWGDMLKRCYSPINEDVARVYYGVTVCGDWHNYQNFAEWFHINHVEGFRLDKDLKDLTKREYSPETCTFLPVELNSFFTGGLKRGIHYNEKRRKWVAQCQNGELCENSGKKKQTYLGAYEHEQEALEVYRDFKRDKLEALLEKYKEHVTPEIISNTHQIINEIK